MNLQSRMRQVAIIARQEARRAFFSKRAFWVYLLALFPAAAFLLHTFEVKVRVERAKRQGITDAALVASIRDGETPEQIIARVGKPNYDRSFTRRRGREEPAVRYRNLGYFDGARRTDLMFKDGVLERRHTEQFLNLEQDRMIFAGIFQMFYLRLAIFFGCLGIFMNLFRGEMLDKTLHFWLLAPVRREVLLGGKYAAGLLASVLIFTSGAVLGFLAMLAPHGGVEVQSFWSQHGAAHLLRYMLAAALGCAGYGSVFLAAGLLLRNPIIPAAVLLLWENVSSYLPSMLQRLSVLHYLQAICPAPMPIDEGTPALVRLFLQPADPPSALAATLGLLVLTALVLLLAARVSRRLEINYSTE